MAQISRDTKNSLEKTTVDISDKALETKEDIGKGAKTAAKSVGGLFSGFKQNIFRKVDDAKGKAEDTRKDIDNTLLDLKGEITKETETIVKLDDIDGKPKPFEPKTESKFIEGKAALEDESSKVADKLADSKMAQISRDTKDIIEKTAVDISDKALETKEDIGKGVTTAAKSVGGLFSGFKENVFGKVDDAKVKAEDTRKAVDNTLLDLKDEIKETNKFIEKEIKDSIQTVADVTVDKKENVGKVVEYIKDSMPDKDVTEKISTESKEGITKGISSVGEAIKDTQQAIDSVTSDVSKKAKEIKGDVELEVIDIVNASEAKTAEFKDEIATKLADTKHDVEKIGSDMKSKGAGGKDKIETKIESSLDNAKHFIDDKSADIKDISKELGKDISAIKDGIGNDLIAKTQEIKGNISDNVTDVGDGIAYKYEDVKASIANKVESGVAIDKNMKELVQTIKDSKEEIEKDLAEATTTDVEDIKGTVEKESGDKTSSRSEITLKEDESALSDKKKSKGFLGKLSSKLGSKSKPEDTLDQSKKVKPKKSKGIFSKVGDKFSQTKDATFDTTKDVAQSMTEKINEVREDTKDASNMTKTALLTTKDDILKGVTKTEKDTTKDNIKDKVSVSKEKLKTEEIKIPQLAEEISDTKEVKRDDVKEITDSFKGNMDEASHINKKEVTELFEKEQDMLLGAVSEIKDIIKQKVIDIDGETITPTGKDIGETFDKSKATSDISIINNGMITTEGKGIEKKINIGRSVEAKTDGSSEMLEDPIDVKSTSQDVKSDTKKQIDKILDELERQTIDVKDGSCISKISELDQIKHKKVDDLKNIKEEIKDADIVLDTIKYAEEEIITKPANVGKELEEKTEKCIDDTSSVLSDDKVSVEGDVRRKPIFRIESEEDSAEDLTSKRDSIKSNILENFSKQKLEALVTDLDVFEDSSLVEPDLSLTEKLETKLNDIEKIIESIEKTESELNNEKIEGKLKRVERKFERMASEVIDTEKEEAKASQLTTPEMEEKQENDFRKVVSQLSTEEVSEFQKEYASLWDEQTFSHTDEWDSTKTPESQADIIELPQGEASVSWEQVTQETTKPTKAEKDEASARTPEPTSHAFDQHQLSEEMKELLKDMEKESKK